MSAHAMPSILVVEDDPTLRLLCCIHLEREHFEVREAATIAEAREAMAEKRPELVFLDVMLGDSACDPLLDDLTAAEIPVVLVSGKTDVAAYRGRVKELLGKPFAPDVLVEVARRLTLG